MLIGPGLTTGYAPWPFPALQEAVDNKDAAMFAAEAGRVVAALAAATERLRSLTKTESAGFQSDRTRPR